MKVGITEGLMLMPATVFLILVGVAAGYLAATTTRKKGYRYFAAWWIIGMIFPIITIIVALVLPNKKEKN
ncbi:MAG: hypothetical protein Q4B26_03880 [Eubacteriales bacterium]|nr:hypothetical protein [Eubacteriales bacterium]